jgi:drug/metabolite transporter (DMT)-like permease
MDWRIAAIVTMLALGVYNILVQQFINVKKIDWRVLIPMVFVASLALLVYFITSYSSFIDNVTSGSILFSFALAFVFCVSTVFTYLTFQGGAQPGIAAIIFNLSAIVTIFISVFLLKTDTFLLKNGTLDLQKILGILFSLLGMILLLYR